VKTLYEAANAAEAHMLVDLLRQQGIAAEIRGEHLQGAVGGLPAMGLVRLVVDEPDFTRARAAIDQWEMTERAESAQSPVSGAPPRYRGFKGFVLGLALGVCGMYGAYRAPATVDGTDYNRDGLLDETWTYALNGRPLKLEVDRNLDRKVDYIAHYDMRGQIQSSESDDDFDGVFETTSRYRDGNVVSSAADTDGDRYPDLHTYFKDGVLDTSEYIKPATGRPVRVEHFQLGKLKFADIDTDDDGQLDTRLTYTPLGEVSARQAIAR
jgi:hypothetical protein